MFPCISINPTAHRSDNKATRTQVSLDKKCEISACGIIFTDEEQVTKIYEILMSPGTKISSHTMLSLLSNRFDRLKT